MVGAAVIFSNCSIVTDDHVAQFRTRLPGLRTEVVPGAGHAVQSDQPLALARLIGEFVFG